MDFEELLDSLGSLERDDDLVEMTGPDGMHVEIPDDPRDQAVADMLDAWRHDVGSKPIPKSIEQIGENMSVAENAAKIRVIASKTQVMGMLQQALQDLNEDQAAAVGAADSSGGSADATQINGAFDMAKESITNAISAVQAAYGAAGDVAAKHGA